MKHQLRRGIGVPVEVAVAELKDHHARHGVIKPQVIVKEARPKKAPLHPVFEWDDSVAAEEYRLVQARNLVRAVHVVVESPDGEDEDAGCAFVHVSEAEGYMPVEIVARNVDMFADALAGLMANLETAQRAVEDLQRWAGKSRTRSQKAKKAGKKIAEAMELLATVK